MEFNPLVSDSQLLLEDESPLILVVDDDPSMRTILGHVLEKDGYRHHLAASGTEAIEFAARSCPHIILMDAVMGDMTGFEATRIILEGCTSLKPIVIMVTALDDESSTSRAYDAGAVDYITKPLHWAVLRERLRHIVKSLRADTYRIIAERQFRKASKMQTIGTLTGGIAHDFNNILSSILGYTELAQLVHPDQGDKLGKYLEEIHKSGNRAKRLIQQMLTFSRGGKIEPTWVDPHEAANNVIKMLFATLPKSIVFKLALAQEVPKIFVDLNQLEQALMNLCINARDAMGEMGTVTIGTRTATVVNGFCASCHQPVRGEYVEISVSDTGTGIDESIQRDLFVPFVSTKKVGAGTGLGLSVVDGIVHEHRGHILMESRVGEGTTFRLLFPIENPARPAEE